MIIGIDYSINSVGITILDGDSTYFHSVISSNELSSMKTFDEDKLPEIKKLALNSLNSYVIINKKPNSFDKKSKNKSMELVRWRRQSTLDSVLVANSVANIIAPYLTPDSVLAIENYKVGSVGDQTIQTIEFTKQFISVLLSSGFDLDRLFWVTAPEVKMLAGKGNFSKKQMSDAFLNIGVKHEMTNFMKTNYNRVVISDKNVLKPCEDVVDSFFIAKLLEKRIKEGLYD